MNGVDLPIIQKVYDLIKWYFPIINRLPRDVKYQLGDRIMLGLYDFLEQLIIARYSREKLEILEKLNARLDILRYQTRLLQELDLIKVKTYEYATAQMEDIGKDLGGWIKQQKGKK